MDVEGLDPKVIPSFAPSSRWTRAGGFQSDAKKGGWDDKLTEDVLTEKCVQKIGHIAKIYIMFMRKRYTVEIFGKPIFRQSHTHYEYVDMWDIIQQIWRQFSRIISTWNHAYVLWYFSKFMEYTFRKLTGSVKSICCLSFLGGATEGTTEHVNTLHCFIGVVF